ncbi:hypothetical protein PVAP13_9KG355514 [Panicum virgatum]|uniref:F-box domain-containing protein n=1 Tax=Panicum virgatum TaxID=38727 RepID=A0A8T0NQ01_PANVG|nr:hypothetical protein PVAP13_9KG355514 [Panicum virgatum]
MSRTRSPRFILTRLPLHQVARGQLVCKRWRDLTADHDFLRSLGAPRRAHPAALKSGSMSQVEVLPAAPGSSTVAGLLAPSTSLSLSAWMAWAEGTHVPPPRCSCTRCGWPTS